MRRVGANRTALFFAGAGTACEGMAAAFFANAAGFEEDMVGVSMTERAEDPASSRASDCMMAKGVNVSLVCDMIYMQKLLGMANKWCNVLIVL